MISRFMIVLGSKDSFFVIISLISVISVIFC